MDWILFNSLREYQVNSGSNLYIKAKDQTLIWSLGPDKVFLFYGVQPSLFELFVNISSAFKFYFIFHF